MREIDDMDILGFLRLRAWDAGRQKQKQESKLAYIDQVWADMAPRT